MRDGDVVLWAYVRAHTVGEHRPEHRPEFNPPNTHVKGWAWLHLPAM